MKKRIVILLLTLPGLLLWNGCTSANKYNLPEQLHNQVSDDLIDAMTTNGFPVYTGENPPCLEGTYLINPNVMIATSVPEVGEFEVGHIFPDISLTFSNQNNNNFTIEIDYIQGIESGAGIGGFIIGDGNYFTVFAINSVVVSGYTCEVLWGFSGKITPFGIEEFHSANFMLDDHNDPGGILIPNNSGRVFNDGSENQLAACIGGSCGTGCSIDLELPPTNSNVSGIWYLISIREINNYLGTDQTTETAYGNMKYEFNTDGTWSVNDMLMNYTGTDSVVTPWMYNVTPPNTFMFYNTHPEVVASANDQIIFQINILNNTYFEVEAEYDAGMIKEITRFQR